MKLIYIILFLLLLIIYAVIYQYWYFISLYFSDPSDFKNYRLGDMIDRDKEIRYNSMGKKYHLKYYQNSIASKYMIKTNDYSNYKILYELVCDYNKEINTPDDVLIIHLRVGDVIEDSKHSVDEHLTKELDYVFVAGNYVKPLSYYQKIIDENKEMPKKAKIFAGGCGYNKKSRSYIYINKIKKFFLNNNFEIIENSYFEIRMMIL